tara:strand:- start:1631 stop:1825 length:195 start_codon:yes stop_codon:yes gene_type:complete
MPTPSDVSERLSAHEAMCEERSKTIFNRLEKIETSLAQLNKNMFVVAMALISGMAGVIWALLMR